MRVVAPAMRTGRRRIARRIDIVTLLLALGMNPASGWAVDAVPAPQGSPASPCAPRELAHRWGRVRAFALDGETPNGQRAIWLRAGMAIDPRGAPNAYCAGDRGLDYDRNAGLPKGNWKRILWGELGAWKPKQQSGAPDEPHAGCYVSKTALVFDSIAEDKPGRYVDASKIPYVSLPKWFADRMPEQLALGDLVAVLGPESNGGRTVAYAIWANTDDRYVVGQGSIALADAIGIRSAPIGGGTNNAVIDYVLLPRSGDGKPLSREEIERRGAAAFRAWGGEGRLAACQR